MDKKLIPDNTEGKKTDLHESVTLNSEQEAEDRFDQARNRMLNPPVWHKLVGALGGEFTLTDAHGHTVHRPAQVNDFFRIDLPGPGSTAGDGYDWVKVEMIEDNTNPGASQQSIGMRVRASRNPQKHKEDTAHFFQGSATSTFIIKKEANTVTASYHGRNEVVNAKTDSTADNIRNTVVALGAYAGFSEMQWSSLIKGFLEPQNSDS